ncbi:MAG TPA: DUF924 domain-containing protein [Gammaproteobacteria bacterium]|nr:DUF924 domain-containing protein [Gammaproteobacteria bacterium]
MTYSDIIRFWFGEIEPESWWKKDATFDQLIRERFSDIHQQAAKCELFEWRQDALGWLAEIIVLDQLPRNMFRDTPQAFATDRLAVILVQEAVSNQVDRELTAPQKSFLYMPLMHSESPLIHETAMELYSQPGLESNLDFEKKHKAIIDRFGRYPHRNTILGRESTDEEVEFLAGPESSF